MPFKIVETMEGSWFLNYSSTIFRTNEKSSQLKKHLATTVVSIDK